MKDTYKDFKSLSSVEKEDGDFQLFINNTGSRIAIVAPHGGGIEPGTSEIAKSIAGEDLTCYCFEGIKNKENKKYLHITSTNFDEPKCIEVCKKSDTVVAIHGADGDDEIVFIGGLNEKLKNRIIEKLKEDGFDAQEDTTNHLGQDNKNICNKGVLKEGLQLEISNGLRKKMFRGLKRNDRKFTTEVFDKFKKSIRSVLCEDEVKET
jgi:phage replication-related protein YjqB (UPF0714/DUF867 family)